MGIIIIVFISCFTIFSYFLFNWLNRGKKHTKTFIADIIYSICIGCVVFFANFSIAENIFGTPHPAIYIPCYGLLIIYPIILSIRDTLKARLPLSNLIFFMGMLLPHFFTPYITDYFQKAIVVFIAIGFTVAYFISLRRYPFRNTMWLEQAVKDCAKECEKGCKFSPKPLVVDGKFKQRWITRTTSGFQLLVKKDRVVMSMPLKLHQKMGKPNLTDFARSMAERILNNINKQEKKEVL